MDHRFGTEESVDRVAEVRQVRAEQRGAQVGQLAAVPRSPRDIDGADASPAGEQVLHDSSAGLAARPRHDGHRVPACPLLTLPGPNS